MKTSQLMLSTWYRN